MCLSHCGGGFDPVVFMDLLVSGKHDHNREIDGTGFRIVVGFLLAICWHDMERERIVDQPCTFWQETVVGEIYEQEVKRGEHEETLS